MRQSFRLVLICLAAAFGPGGLPASAQTMPAGSPLPRDGFFDPQPIKERKTIESRPLAPPAPAGEPRAEGPSPEAKVAEPKVAKPKVVKPKTTPVTPRETALSNDPRPSFAADTAMLTMLAAERYLGIANAGGWPTVSAAAPLKEGMAGPEIGVLRRRLAVSGDLAPEAEAGQVFDAELTEAVKRFQMRHGLRQTGIVAARTLKELNVGAAERHRQLVASAERIAPSQFPFGPRYVVVNIPAAAVEAVEDGQVKRRHVAVVGKPDRASPSVEARIQSVNLNPTWTVPVSIIKKDIIPKMQKDPGYLAKQKIRILNIRNEEIDPARIDWSTERATAFTLRQDPGAGNSLGQIRIDMPNKLAVYMHDTPSKKLFASDQRFHSSGCVRVENVREFSAWLLEGAKTPGDGPWDKAAIDAGIASGERKDIRLKAPVPVAWVYLTGYATADGTVHFRPDVYGLDDADASLPTASLAPVPPQRAPSPLSQAPASAMPQPRPTTLR